MTYFFKTRKIKSKFIHILRKYYVYLTLKIPKIGRKNAHLEYYMQHRKHLFGIARKQETAKLRHVCEAFNSNKKTLFRMRKNLKVF